MIAANSLAVQDKSPSVLFIFYMRVSRYLKVGYLLHLMGLGGIALFLLFGSLTLNGLGIDPWWLSAIYGYCCVYGFSLPIFAELDARSRYQNYKLIKDKMYENGFHNLLVKPLSHSRCQRDAVMVAATDLGKKKEVKRYFRQLGYRWFHILPRMVIRDPFLLISIDYWKKTLLVKHYSSKHFLW